MDALFEQLKRNAIGCHVGPVYAGAFGYADDVALVASSLYSLRCMIATSEAFANKYQIDFKADELDSFKKFCILSENVIFHE